MKTTVLKKFRPIALLLVLAMLATFACSCASFVKNADDNAPTPEAAATPQLNYVSLRINPEIELVTDENDVVVSANAINADGEIVLVEMEDVTDKTVEEVAEDFAETSTELGYVDVESEDTTVYVDATAEDEETSERLKEKVATRIHHFFDNHGIYGKVSPETLEKYAEAAKEWDVSKGTMKLIMRLLDLYPEMTVEEALELSLKEVNELIRDAAKKTDRVTPSVKDSLKEAVEALNTEYAAMFELQKEIRELHKQLKDEELTEEARTALKTTLEEKKAAYKELFEAYKAAVLALKEECKKQAEAKMEEAKAAAEAKRGHHAEKWQKHKDAFEKDREDRKESIRNWREKEKHVITPKFEKDSETDD